MTLFSVIYVLWCKLILNICHQACSLCKVRVSFADETPPGNWGASFTGICRCYTTAKHYSQPPSDSSMYVIILL